MLNPRSSGAKPPAGFDLCKGVAESEYRKLKAPPKPEHDFEVTLEEDCFSEEKYQLFINYQHHIHHESLSSISSSEGFKRFLCSSPLKKKEERRSGIEQKLGSFHQCYRLDGRLIAMSVVDLLPKGVSAVYFIHHVDFQRWSFGKLSALREIAMALKTERLYYYMGYYIHSCVKMRYKGDYKPQQMLDPESLEWNPLDERMKRLLNLKPFVSLSHEYEIEAIGANNKLVDHVGRKIFDKPSKAAEAVLNGLSLFQVAMPGVMTLKEMVSQIDLDSIKVEYGPRKVCQAAVWRPFLSRNAVSP